MNKKLLEATLDHYSEEEWLTKRKEISASIDELQKQLREQKAIIDTEKSRHEEEDWVNNSYTDLLQNLQGIQDVQVFGDSLIGHLCHSTQSEIGAIYFLSSFMSGHRDAYENEHLILLSLYGKNKQDTIDKIQLHDGILGQIAVEGKSRLYTDDQCQHIKIGSSLGQTSAKTHYIFPILFEDKVVAIIELASISMFKDRQYKLLKQIGTNLGVTISNMQQIMVSKNLLEEIQISNGQLASQKEALDSSAIVAETDEKGKITYVNDKFVEISRFSREELIGKDHRILNSGYHPKSFFKDLWTTIKNGHIWKGEVKNRTKDGGYYWVDTTIYPVKNSAGIIEKYIAIRFDVTDIKKAETLLKETTDKAKSESQVKSAFLANMSHEIRTPLNGIIGYIDLLLEKSELQGESLEYTNIIKDCSEGLRVLIDDILEFSKIESGNIDLEKINVSIKDLVDNTVKLFTQKAASKSIEIECHTDSRVPATIVTDPNRLRQILINLVSNALKFTENGKIKVEVKVVRISEHECTLQFSVQDTGIGIEKHKLETIFQKFNQADSSTTRKYGGTGLGLAISRNLCQIMGGKIWVDSSPNKGSTFYFTISGATQSTMTDTKNLFPLEGKPSDIKIYTPFFKKQEELSILIAEDNPINQKLISRYLETTGYRYDIVSNGQEACESVKSKHYDMIFMDVNMPIMDGVAATKYIKENIPKDRIPFIVALTANSMPGDKNKFLSAGMDGYLSKPIKKHELIDYIKKVIDLKTVA